MARLADAIDTFVKGQLYGVVAPRIRGPKVIHDTVLGSNRFFPWEIAILDLPFMQRLRRVSQCDVVSLVFPSGNHNRFEHTLGVTVIADKLARAVRTGALTQDSQSFDDDMILHIRLAAILHDVGHGPLSHQSESIFRNCEDFVEEKSQNPKLQHCAAHEALSFLIVTSQSFRTFFAEQIEKPYGIHIDLDFVAEMIVGHVSDPSRGYVVDVVNGAFDADKLDYIQRDSHFTGIKMVLDLDRLFYTVGVITNAEGRKCLSVDITGVSTLEQIVFNKMMLFCTVYHHHKVRAAECVFRSIFEMLASENTAVAGQDCTSAAHYLSLSDVDIYSLQRLHGPAGDMARDLCDRRLPKRAAVISRRTVTPESQRNLRDFMKLHEVPERIALLRDVIIEIAANQYGVCIPANQLWVDVPREPEFDEAMKWPIISSGSESGYVSLRSVMPVDDWVRAFAENKWQGYVFTRPEYRAVVHQASTVAFREVFGIELNEYSRILCKMDDDEEPVEPAAG